MDSVIQERDATAPAPPRRRAWAAWLDPTEPHLPRGPFTRWPRATDVALAVVVFVVSLLAVTVSALRDEEDFTLAAIGDRPVGAIVLLALAAVALLRRRDRPIVVTIVVLVVMVGWAFAGHGDGQELALVVAIYSVGRYTSDPHHNAAALAAVIAISVLGTVIDDNQRVDVLPAILLTALPWYVGRRVRNRGAYLALLRERALRLEAEQHDRARRAVADERARIARELHDVVAHQVSMMTVQAGAAKTVAHNDLDAAVEAMGDVERAGRRALGELRHLLGVLRPDTPDSVDLGPQPGLADISSLADDLAHTGAEVTLELPERPDGLTAAVELSAYRIVQESLTNVLKHAGPDPTVDITIDADDDALVIDITNTTTGMPPDLPGSGYGIAGMRERATLLGGTLAAGPHGPGRYRVRAVLPTHPESP